MCSHIIYAYATIDDHRPEIIPIQKEDIGNKKIRFLWNSHILHSKLESVSFK